PGPDVVFLVAQGATRGRKAGLFTALGLSAGNLVHTLGAALGLSVVFRTSALAFSAVKFAGAAYLLYLAWKTVGKKPVQPGAAAPMPPRGHTLFARGFLMNVLNPKVALFFLAFLPQFATPERGPVWVQMAILGLVFTVQVVVVFGTIGLCAGSISPWLQRGRNGRLGRAFDWLIGSVYAALALRLVLAER
ncbi:MAG: LysE family translocator, partial [Candidatus Hydrogenedentes bacterium]|nr:LysE family translocator [Candidatus Hydrogenedentota bacterium]